MSEQPSSLADRLKDWTDWDVALHAVGVALGLFPSGSQMADFKGVFWSRNKLCDPLSDILDALVNCGALTTEGAEETSAPQVRWLGQHLERYRREVDCGQ